MKSLSAKSNFIQQHIFFSKDNIPGGIIHIPGILGIEHIELQNVYKCTYSHSYLSLKTNSRVVVSHAGKLYFSKALVLFSFANEVSVFSIFIVVN